MYMTTLPDASSVASGQSHKYSPPILTG